jgi:hypothetical protein
MPQALKAGTAVPFQLRLAYRATAQAGFRTSWSIKIQGMERTVSRRSPPFLQNQNAQVLATTGVYLELVNQKYLSLLLAQQ